LAAINLATLLPILTAIALTMFGGADI
jgi:hypothetical protein